MSQQSKYVKVWVYCQYLKRYQTRWELIENPLFADVGELLWMAIDVMRKEVPLDILMGFACTPWREERGIIATDNYGKDDRSEVRVPSQEPKGLNDFSEIKKALIVERVR